MTKPVRNFLRISAPERRLLLKALGLVALIRSALTFLPLRTLRGITSRLMVPGRAGRRNMLPPERIAWAVTAASRYVPRATCLTQALSAQIFLVRRGYDAVLRIGVARDRSGAFIAHAWVEQEGRVIIGGQGYEEFTPLPLNGERGV